MFPMTVTLNTRAQLNAVLQALQPDLDAGDFKDPTVGAAYVEAKARVAKVEPATKPAPATAGKGAPAADVKPTAEGAVVDAPETKALTYDADVAPALLALVKAKGRPTATGLLSEFKATRGTDLKPEQFVAFVTQAKALMS